MQGEELVITVILSAGYIAFATWLYFKTSKNKE